ncbi:deleted in malignant brain tumors 1 protein-like isoform X4 [Anolis sagrei]|uniref:deleted in malignant brain tumors 1 protein-like isoform X4 n=1 Tax=Anolis sagrei TaxID=38937 RepID=UPI00352138A9
MGSSIAESDHMEIRLEGGPNLCSGRVEVFLSGQWTSVCDDSWGIEEAMVVCRQLGCGSAVSATHEAQFGNGWVPIGLDDVRCGGAESTLSECPASPWGEHHCSHEETAGVICSGQLLGSDPTQQTEIRLAGGLNNCSGRVELLHHGEWGTICGDGWGIEEATVVCQEMGCGTASLDQSRTWHGSGSSPIWLDDVHCRGTESALHQCSASPLGRYDCDRRKTASVVCSDVRLVDGPTPCSGRVEVFHSKGWGTVCSNGWDLEDARVVCQEIGCGEALAAGTEVRFGQGSGPIWMDPVNCTGKENVLKECPHEKSLNLTCDHRNDASVECAVVRLSDGHDRCAGKVELLHEGQWRMVEYPGLGDKESRVVCRYLGCGTALHAPGYPIYGEIMAPFWLDDFRCNGSETSLSQCERGPRREYYYDSDRLFYMAGVICSELRLVNGPDRCSGYLEVLHNQQWGTVCDSGWDARDAQVVCRELNCGDVSTAFGGVRYGQGSGLIWLENVNCTGEETSLAACPKSPWGKHSCNHSQDVSVQCSGQFRLVNGSSLCSGRVEMFLQQQWKAICDDNWDLETAEMFCKTLNCGQALSALRGSHFGRKYNPIKINLNYCKEGRDYFTLCDLRDWGPCNSGGSAGVICSEVRLVNGTNRCSGRIELVHNQEWGTVCDATWDKSDAQVVCRELGCGNALKAFRGAHHGQGSGPIWLEGLNCMGKEASLRECPRSPWGEHHCTHSQDASVECTGWIRLVNSSSHCSGTVEVLHEQQWKAICDKNWGVYEDHVVCREMGCRAIPWNLLSGPFLSGKRLSIPFCKWTTNDLTECDLMDFKEGSCSHGRAATVTCSGTRLVNGSNHCSGRVETFLHREWWLWHLNEWDLRDAQVVCREVDCGEAVSVPGGSFFGEGEGPILPYEPKCLGTEAAFHKCVFNSPNRIRIFEMTGVVCSEDLRLMNGTSPCSGRVEVFHSDAWGTICDASWDLQDAQVVCRQLGCGKAYKALAGAHYGQGTDPIWLENINCTGEEAFLKECQKGGWGEHSCSHSQDASVECSGTRLVNGTNHCSGRVEVFMNGKWGSVCDDRWDLRDAQVVCRELGCGGAVSAPGEAHFGEGNGTIWIDEAKCLGTEVVLQKCPFEKQNDCNHGEDAGVVCSDLRLMNGTSPCSGRVEVFHNDLWGTVCDAGWDLQGAQVVCRQLGCGDASKALGGAHYGQGSGPIWMESINCTGEEASLKECQKGSWGEHSCNHSQDASVECSVITAVDSSLEISIHLGVAALVFLALVGIVAEAGCRRRRKTIRRRRRRRRREQQP